MPLLPADIGSIMVASRHEEVKTEQNNCCCSVCTAEVDTIQKYVYRTSCLMMVVSIQTACATTVRTRCFFPAQTSHMQGVSLWQSPTALNLLGDPT